MRRLLASFAVIGLLQLGLGCRHTAGVCDCGEYPGQSHPVSHGTLHPGAPGAPGAPIAPPGPVYSTPPSSIVTPHTIPSGAPQAMPSTMVPKSGN